MKRDEEEEGRLLPYQSRGQWIDERKKSMDVKNEENKEKYIPKILRMKVYEGGSDALHRDKREGGVKEREEASLI